MWKMQKHWSNSQNDGQHKISSLADYILWYIYTLLCSITWNTVNAFFLLSTRSGWSAVLLAIHSSFSFSFYHDGIGDCGCVRECANVYRVCLCLCVCAWDRIFDIFSHTTVSVVCTIYTQCSTFIQQTHTHEHTSRHSCSLFNQCGMLCICTVARSVNGSSIMNSKRQCMRVFSHRSLRIGMQRCVCVCSCECICVLALVYFIFLQLLNMDDMPNAVLPPFKNRKKHTFVILASNEIEIYIITVIINKREGKQHTRASPSAIQYNSIQNKYHIGTTVFRVFSHSLLMFCDFKHYPPFILCI